MPTNLFVSVLSAKTNPRSINLAIESQFFLDPKDVEDNSSLLEKVKGFINKLQDTIAPHPVTFRRTLKKEILTDFLTELGKLVMNIDDNKFSTLTQDLKDVVDKKGETPAFNEVLRDKYFIQFIKTTVNEWSKTEPTKLKLEIARYVTDSENESIFVTFFQKLNKYFIDTDKFMLSNIVKDFKKAIQGNDYKNVLNKAVDFIIRDKFKKANKEFIKSFDNDVMELSGYLMNKGKTDTTPTPSTVPSKLNVGKKSFNATTDDNQSDMSEEVQLQKINKVESKFL